MTSRAATEWLNWGALAVAISASAYAAMFAVPTPETRSFDLAPPEVSSVEPVALADGRRALSDATGTWVPVSDYRRIASGTLLADPLLLALCEPERIAAFSAQAPRARDAYRYAGKPSIDATHRMEQLIALKPDLVLVNSLGEHAWVQRLRDAGLVVFDLGPMWGVATFLRNIAVVGHLVQRPDAARDLAWRFQARLSAIARDLPRSARRRAMYVGLHGNQLYGGTRGSSYHDVLSYAGLVDIAADSYRGWPVYSAEDLLALAPEVVVTTTGGRARLCGHAELQRMTACTARGKVIELHPDLLSDAGLGMLDAAEELHRAVYGNREQP